MKNNYIPENSLRRPKRLVSVAACVLLTAFTLSVSCGLATAAVEVFYGGRKALQKPDGYYAVTSLGKQTKTTYQGYRTIRLVEAVTSNVVFVSFLIAPVTIFGTRIALNRLSPSERERLWRELWSERWVLQKLFSSS